VSQSDEVVYVKRQYASEDNLAIRIRTHELYTEPQYDFIDWVLGHVAWRGDETVLDVGCGSGGYVTATRLRAQTVVAGDFSFGMLAGLAFAGLQRVNLNAERLPYAANSAEIILANHMIYHVADRPAAVAEFHRVLKPGGTLLAATNSSNSMAELNALLRAAAKQLGAKPMGLANMTMAFTLENGLELLKTVFEHIAVDVIDAAFVFPAAQPVVDYLATTQERHVARLPGGTTWHDLAQVLRDLVQTEIDAHGVFRVSKKTGVFVCQK
jgi:SAM-dependent methyltransferase